MQQGRDAGAHFSLEKTGSCDQIWVQITPPARSGWKREGRVEPRAWASGAALLEEEKGVRFLGGPCRRE